MSDRKHLNILWTNDNVITAEKMVFMYATNAVKHGWWEEVTIIVWGATVTLASEHQGIRDLIKEAKSAGVHVSVCKACAEQLGVVDKLEQIDLELIYWGEPLTGILKGDEKLITI